MAWENEGKLSGGEEFRKSEMAIGDILQSLNQEREEILSRVEW